LWISIEDIAEKFIQYYWRQSVPYINRGGICQVIRQNTDRQAQIVRYLIESRPKAEGSLAKIKLNQSLHRSLAKKVAKVVQVMPLFKLQTLGKEKVEFLYLNRIIRGGIELLPGVCFCLRQFHLIIRDLVQSAWIRFIHRVRGNQEVLGQSQDLAEFLFGSERTNLSAFSAILKELQKGRCFYCQRGITISQTVDHFIPWVRYPVDLGHNFVLAHQTCNSAKSDTLAAVRHLERWWQRNEDHGKVLSEVFNSKGLIHDLKATKEISRWAYELAESSGAQVWAARDQYEALGTNWRKVTGFN
jgi:hypothetical protein